MEEGPDCGALSFVAWKVAGLDACKWSPSLLLIPSSPPSFPYLPIYPGDGFIQAMLASLSLFVSFHFPSQSAHSL